MRTYSIFSLGLALLFTSSAAQAGEAAGDYSWKKCERADLSNATIPFDKDGKFLPECAPDTLWSWGSQDKLETLAEKATPDNILPIKYLYTWRTPIGTYNYGNTAIRIKLKPGTKFKIIDANNRNCGSLPDEEHTVFVAHLDWIKWSEYILCSPGPVESWSMNTAEGAHEMELEKKWVETHKQGDFDWIMKDAGRCAGCLVNYGPDWGRYRTSDLNDSIERAKKMSRKGQEKIMYAKGVKPDRKRHFATARPGYFNPPEVLDLAVAEVAKGIQRKPAGSPDAKIADAPAKAGLADAPAPAAPEKEAALAQKAN